MNPKLEAKRILSRVRIEIRAPEPLRWYSQKELAQLWDVHPVTVRKWLMVLRKQGRGPGKDQASMRRINAARRFLLIRGDYAVFMYDQVVVGLK